MSGITSIVKAFGFSPMATAIILALLSIIVFFLGLFYKMVKKSLEKVITTRNQEIAVVKLSLEELTNKIDDIQNQMNKNTDITNLLAYHQCMNEAMNWQDKGEIPVGAKMHFEKVWQAYEELGDGYGDDPKRMVDGLRVV